MYHENAKLHLLMHVFVVNEGLSARTAKYALLAPPYNYKFVLSEIDFIY